MDTTRHLLNGVKESLKSDLDCDVFLRASLRGVPHLVFNFKDSSYAQSICYFKKQKLYKIFTPYGTEGVSQRVYKCDDYVSIVETLLKIKE